MLPARSTHTFNIAWTFACQKNLFALDAIQFVNRSKKGSCRLVERNGKNVYDIVTGDELWIYAYEPESKQQSTVWVFQDEPNPTKVPSTRCTSKQMISCFFWKTGHVTIVRLEQRRTVNSEWYTTIFLPVVFQEIRKTNRQRPHSLFTTTMRALPHRFKQLHF